MSELTTTGGLTIQFDPSAVTAVADHDADTGDAVTTVYGVTAGAVEIAETVDGFLMRIGVAQSFAEFTRPDGSFVWLNCKAVGTIRPPLPDEYPAQAETVISVGSLTQAVDEAPDAVRQAVNAHGGKL